MSKAVLMSIHPEWCELIASGRKTIEARKTYPKEKPPFKVYIYSTLGTSAITYLWKKDGKVFTSPSADVAKEEPAAHPINCKVIGEFVCDGIYRVLDHPDAFAGHPLFHTKAIEDACLTNDEVEKYSDGKDVFGWHISDLVIYDHPKELGEFLHFCEYDFDEVKCIGCKNMSYNDLGQEACDRRFTRPPQSWCYAEVLE
ncbi:MAG: ASCH domain-containing protein [Clostridia bacterium]|nr:ASCH domain-containing protein [Clostridia bacterium]